MGSESARVEGTMVSLLEDLGRIVATGDHKKMVPAFPDLGAV